jgi:anti-sigma regulatory factor (Ser/Thr protein kinase)
MKAAQVVIGVADLSHVGEVRRRVNQLTAEAQLPESESGKAAIVATELATNLARYATGGEMILSCVTPDRPRPDQAADQNPVNAGWVEMISVDRGPGIADVGRCLEDGYSTGGGMGNGLGAVRRLSTEWDVYSTQATESSSTGGTVIFSRVAAKGTPISSALYAWGAISRPAPREHVCGDGWRIALRNADLTLMLVDGLGHGVEAAEAANEAVDVFDCDPFAPLPTIFQNAGARLQRTRGGAMAAARVEGRNRKLKFVGVGNIGAHLRAREESAGRGLVSHNGIVGAAVRKIQEFEYDCPVDGLLVLHSDGLQSRWQLERYAGLMARHPAVIAGILYRDFTRGPDDVTVAVVRLSLSGINAAGTNAAGTTA